MGLFWPLTPYENYNMSETEISGHRQGWTWIRLKTRKESLANDFCVIELGFGPRFGSGVGLGSVRGSLADEDLNFLTILVFWYKFGSFGNTTFWVRFEDFGMNPWRPRDGIGRTTGDLCLKLWSVRFMKEAFSSIWIFGRAPSSKMEMGGELEWSKMKN